MTRRERLEARLAKRQEWAKSRANKSDQSWKAHNAVSLPYGGEPIKVGHHSESRHRNAIAKSHALAFKALEHRDMAQHHNEKASGLADQLESCIFSDDADAIESLEARITEREAERDRIKAYNTSCRKGSPDESILDDHQRADIASIRKHCPYQLRAGGQFPAYVSSNLSAKIKTDRDRIATIKRQAQRTATAKQNGGVYVHTCEGYTTIVFDDKPSRDIIDSLKASGFRWGRGAWRGLDCEIPASVQAIR